MKRKRLTIRKSVYKRQDVSARLAAWRYAKQWRFLYDPIDRPSRLNPVIGHKYWNVVV